MRDGDVDVRSRSRSPRLTGNSGTEGSSRGGSSDDKGGRVYASEEAAAMWGSRCEATQRECNDHMQWPCRHTRFAPVVNDATQEVWRSRRNGLVTESWTYGWTIFLMSMEGNIIWHSEEQNGDWRSRKWTKWKRYIYPKQLDEKEDEYEDGQHKPVIWNHKEVTVYDENYVRGWAHVWRSPDGNVLWHEERIISSNESIGWTEWRRSYR